MTGVESTFLTPAPLSRRHRLSVTPFSGPPLLLSIEATLIPRLNEGICRLFFFHLYRLYPHASDALVVKFKSLGSAHAEVDDPLS